MGSRISEFMISLNALHAVVDIHEAAGLVAGAPDLDFVLAAELGLDHLAANGRRGLFAAAIPGAVRTIDVVEAGHACAETEILPEVAAHPLARTASPSRSRLRPWRGKRLLL